MASALNQKFRIGTTETPLLLGFSPSVSPTAKPYYQIDSRKPERLQGIHSVLYTMNVTLDGLAETLTITEKVTGAKGSYAIGTLLVPYSKLETPHFICNANKGRNYIKLSFPLREGARLDEKHYKSKVRGKWNENMRQKLQMCNIEDWAKETWSINISLLKAPKDASGMRADIAFALGLATEIITVTPSPEPAVLQVQHNDCARKIQDLEEEVDELRTQAVNTKSEARSLQERLYILVEEYSDAEAEIKSHKDTIHELQGDLTHVYDECQAIQNRNKFLEDTLRSLTKPAPSEAHPCAAASRIASNETWPASESCSLHVAGASSLVEAISIFSVDDQSMIEQVTPMSQVLDIDREKQFKVTFMSHWEARDVLRRTIKLIQTEYEPDAAYPGLYLYLNDRDMTAQQPSENTRDNSSTSLQFEADEDARLTEQIKKLSADNEKFESKFSVVQRAAIASTAQINSLQAEVKTFKQQLTSPIMPPLEPISEETLIDLFGLDFNPSVSMPGASTLPSAKLSPADYHLSTSDDPDSFRTAKLEQFEAQVPQSDEDTLALLESTDADNPQPHPLSPPVTMDEIAYIDQATHYMSLIQQDALRSGKAVTMEIRDTAEMLDWLIGEKGESEVGRRQLIMVWSWRRV